MELVADNTEVFSKMLNDAQDQLRKDLAQIRINHALEMAAFWVEIAQEEPQEPSDTNALATFAMGLRGMKKEVA